MHNTAAADATTDDDAPANDVVDDDATTNDDRYGWHGIQWHGDGDSEYSSVTRGGTLYDCSSS